jgi:predicted YcjX-like family ATPase
MVIGTIADTLTRSVENITGTLSETFFEPTLRLGVTGLSRAGKTVFITSLVANLMDRARMPQLVRAASCRRSCSRNRMTPCRASITKRT